MKPSCFLHLSLGALMLSPVHGAEAPTPGALNNPLTEQLRALDPNVLSAEQRQASSALLRTTSRDGIRAVNASDRAAWSKIETRQDWENWTTPRLAALRRSLGIFPPPPENLNEQITRVLPGEGFQIENIVFQSRPGLIVTANLYLPSPRRDKMPGIIVVHSHHNPKTQGELQDMGMTWARQGCVVLVMDQLSYGERRQHQAGGRQDYRFRYINGLQLHAIGDSLMGWMVWDIMRSVDLLLRRPGLDAGRIALIGSVAGGGDPAAVAAALDSRITCAVPFNFGGPQPETRYPLPADADETFNYLGGGSWESTRNLRSSGRDGFLPWTIVGSMAPRRLIYAHEFSWDGERDPVWTRLQRIFGFYGASDQLAVAHGGGLLQGQPPEATHCNNVGAVHRQMIHPALERWFGIPIPQEYQARRNPEELACLTPAIKPRPLHELYAEIADSRIAAARVQLQALSREQQQVRLRQQWASLLGEIDPQRPTLKSKTTERIALDADTFETNRPAAANPKSKIQNPKSVSAARNPRRTFEVERIVLEPRSGLVLPLLLLVPRSDNSPPPLVIGLSQHGKSGFLKERARVIAALLENGVAVCLPDVRGVGETSPPGARHYRSEATSVSATELMLGRTLLGSRLADLRTILGYLRSRADLNSRQLALWGDSFAETNPRGFPDPLIDDGEAPRHSEPLGGLLALLGALFENDVRAVAVSGTLAGYQALLRDRFCYLPHDAVVPGALTAGDLADVAAALAPRPLRMARLVDGRNVLMTEAEAKGLLQPVVEAHRSSKDGLLLLPPSDAGLAGWLSAAVTQN